MKIYSTFYHANKPEGIENRKAYIIGGGIAGLAAAAGKNVSLSGRRTMCLPPLAP